MKLVKGAAFTVTLGFIMPLVFGWLPEAFLQKCLTVFFAFGVVVILIMVPVWMFQYVKGL